MKGDSRTVQVGKPSMHVLTIGHLSYRNIVFLLPRLAAHCFEKPLPDRMNETESRGQVEAALLYAAIQASRKLDDQQLPFTLGDYSSADALASAQEALAGRALSADVHTAMTHAMFAMTYLYSALGHLEDGASLLAMNCGLRAMDEVRKAIFPSKEYMTAMKVADGAAAGGRSRTDAGRTADLAAQVEGRMAAHPNRSKSQILNDVAKENGITVVALKKRLQRQKGKARKK